MPFEKPPFPGFKLENAIIGIVIIAWAKIMGITPEAFTLIGR